MSFDRANSIPSTPPQPLPLRGGAFNKNKNDGRYAPVIFVLINWVWCPIAPEVTCVIEKIAISGVALRADRGFDPFAVGLDYVNQTVYGLGGGDAFFYALFADEEVDFVGCAAHVAEVGVG